MSQLSLLDGVEIKPKSRVRVPFRHESDTSEAAAKAIAPYAGRMRANVYRSVIAAGDDGLTRRELEGITGYLTQTLCARLRELERGGHIRKLVRLHDGALETVTRERCAIYVAVRGGDFEEAAA